MALLSALVVVAVCVAGYLLSAPTDAAPPLSGPSSAPRVQEALALHVQVVASGRDRPAERPVRSDYDDPSHRARASALEAVLYRDGKSQE